MRTDRPIKKISKETIFVKAIMPDLLAQGLAGYYALAHEEELAGMFNTEQEALDKGDEMFGRPNFWIQLIAE